LLLVRITIRELSKSVFTSKNAIAELSHLIVTSKKAIKDMYNRAL